LSTLVDNFRCNFANAVVFDLQSHSEQVTELFSEHLSLHLMPAISHSTLQLVVFLRLLFAVVRLNKLSDFILEAVSVVVVLHAEVKLVDVLTQTILFKIRDLRVVHLIFVC